MSGHSDGLEISAYLDGMLPAETRARVELHFSSCAECRAQAESLRHLKLALSSAPRKTLPPDLALAMERRFTHATAEAYSWLRPALWVPAGALAAAGLAVSLWLRSAAGAAEEVPLESLLAAHARYSAEALVPEDNLVASSYSDQLSSLYEGADAELE